MRLLGEIRNYLGNYHLKSGVYHLDRREFGQALGFLRKALASDAEITDAERRTARGYMTHALKGLSRKLAEEGQLDGALAAVEEAAAQNPDHPDVQFALAGLLRRLGRLPESIAAYGRAIACHPGYLDAHVALAESWVEAGRLDEAAGAYRQALEVKLDRIRVPFRQAIEHLEAGRTAEAAEWFHETFLAAPQLSGAHLEKALDEMRAGEHERALACLDQALALSPKYPDLHNYRGIVLCDLEQFADAAAAFRRSAELCPDHLVPRLNLAFALERAGCALDAEAELETVLASDPAQPVALARLRELRAARAVPGP